MIVIGVGNDFRRDDGAGLEVARRLQGQPSAGVRILTVTGEAGELIQFWENQDCVILIDAVVSSHRPGTVLRFDATEVPLDAELFGVSSHSFGVHAAVELARALDQLPQRLTIFGIVGKNFSEGTGLSEAVEAGVCEVVTAIETTLGRSTITG